MSLYSPRFSTPSRTRARTSPMEPMEISGFALDDNDTSSTDSWKHLYVLPVLLLEFLALALTRAVLPSLLLEEYKDRVYIVMGVAECVRGLLAFFACPLFGKLSDVVGRKSCLFVTVAGTCAPVCSLALLSWSSRTPMEADSTPELNVTSILNVTTSGIAESPEEVWFSPTSPTLHPNAIHIFVTLLALSGIFSSTFTLVFCYISDTLERRKDRVSAYGLALATFGLSFTIGPLMGGYLAQYNTHHVFLCSLLLTLVDLLYIYAILPESLQDTSSSNRSIASLQMVSWSPWDTLRIIVVDPFLRLVAKVAFLYYTALWAVISTLVLYAAKRFHLSPQQLGELMSLFGLTTMLAEAVMVRIVVPILGERKSMQVGLLAFMAQCVVLGFANQGWHLFLCIVFSMIGNLVYPSLSSLVSSSVDPNSVGEALGAVNGIKALTEGIGPLVFGSFMTLSEKSALPGWPYLVAALLVYMAYYYSQELKDDDDYIHELERKRHDEPPSYLKLFSSPTRQPNDEEEEYQGLLNTPAEDLKNEEEYVRMLSDIEESDDDMTAVESETQTAQSPATFASLMGNKSLEVTPP